MGRELFLFFLTVVGCFFLCEGQSSVVGMFMKEKLFVNKDREWRGAKAEKMLGFCICVFRAEQQL